MNELALKNTFTTKEIPAFFKVLYTMGSVNNKLSRIEEEAKELDKEFNTTLDESIHFFSNVIDGLVRMEKTEAKELYAIVKDVIEKALRYDDIILQENTIDNFLSSETVDKLKRSDELMNKAFESLKVIAFDNDIDEESEEFENFLIDYAENTLKEDLKREIE